MGKIDKKREKLVERVATLEQELTDALTKKSSNQKEINVAHQTTLINEAKHKLEQYDRSNKK